MPDPYRRRKVRILQKLIWVFLLFQVPAQSRECGIGDLRALLQTMEQEAGPLYRVKLQTDLRSMVLEGRLQKLSLAPDYELYFLKDEQGRIHLFDSKHLASDQDLRVIQETSAAPAKRAEVVVSQDQVKRHLCAQYQRLGGSPEFKRLEPLLEKKLTIGKLRETSLGRCILNGAAFMIPALVADPSQVLRNHWAKEKTHSELRQKLDHLGNFYETMILMGAIQHCSVLAGAASGPALLKALKVGAVGNVVSEVNVAGAPIPNLPHTVLGADEIFPDRKRSDWGDLASGTLGIGAYGVWSVLSRNLFSFRFEKACR